MRRTTDTDSADMILYNVERCCSGCFLDEFIRVVSQQKRKEFLEFVVSVFREEEHKRTDDD